MAVTEFAVRLPHEWRTSEPVHVERLAGGMAGELPVALTAIVLDDRSMIYVLAWPGGSRIARLSPLTDRAIEERFDGDQPPLDDDPRIEMWRLVMEIMADANREAREEGL